MNKSKCPACGSTRTVKNGLHKGIQTFKCNDCGYRFRNLRLPSDCDIWNAYQEGKQTIAELAKLFNTSESTIKRRLHNISKEWRLPDLHGMSGFIHLDATYWGHNWGVMAAIDTTTGQPLYMSFIRSETNQDYKDAVQSIEERGYTIRGMVIDGKQALFTIFSGYKIQMCQFHMKQIIKRYLTNNPRLKVARALKELTNSLTKAEKNVFTSEYRKWKENWNQTLNHKSQLKSGKMQYTHKRLRSAMRSLDFYLPYLFTCQESECQGMPNTNNKIEGTFTDLKKNLNNHSGMSVGNRKRFISGFFSALDGRLHKESESHKDPR